MESFFATLKKEKLYRIDTRCMGRDAVKSIIFRYIHYYNLRRIYSPNGGWPPMVFRNRHAARAA
jgi:putative transposase